MSVATVTYTSEDIVGKLPRLRRYARALTGSQAAGDGYVRGCIEVIIRDRPTLSASLDLQRELFRLFHRVYASADPRLSRGGEGAPSTGNTVEVQRLPAVERQVLLLSALEHYSFSDIGHILGVSEDLVRELFNKAQESMTALRSARILIIEDEPVIALELRAIVEAMGHTVVGTADREKDSIAIAERTSPELVLADIQLRGGDSGIEAVRHILSRLRVPVIFVTAFPERLLTGHGIEPTFILSKPYDPAMVRAAVSQALLSASEGALVG